jgi:hypothetical protein
MPGAAITGEHYGRPNSVQRCHPRADAGFSPGIQLAHNWTTQNNGVEFGSDYFTRAAVAKSNIFVNSSRETKCFYQDFDDSGAQLNGNKGYMVTLCQGRDTPRIISFLPMSLSGTRLVPRTRL